MGIATAIHNSLLLSCGGTYIACKVYFDIEEHYFFVATLKTFPVILLFLQLLLTFPSKSPTLQNYKFWILLELLFSAVADFVIEKPSQFLAGVGVFMIVHGCLLKAFIPTFQLINRFQITIVLILWAAFVVSFTYSLPDFVIKCGVYIYIVIILSMLWITFNQHPSLPSPFLSLIKRASVYFAISDTFIAMKKFLFHPLLVEYGCTPTSTVCFTLFGAITIDHLMITFALNVIIIGLYWYSQFLFTRSVYCREQIKQKK